MDGSRRSDSQIAADSERAAQRYFLLIALVFIIIMLRLLFLQVGQYWSLVKTSLDNVLRSVTIAPPRGTIYDRFGAELAVSRQNYGLLYVPPNDLAAYMPDNDVRRMLRITNRDYHYLRLPPKAELPAGDPAPELIEQADLLFERCPTPELLLEQLGSSMGPFRDPSLSVSFTALLRETGQLAEQRRFAEAFAHYIGSQGLSADFDQDSLALERFHRYEPEPGPPSPLGEAFAEAQYALFRDQYRLARWYIQLARVRSLGPAARPLAEIVSIARFLGKPGVDPDKTYVALMRRLDSSRAKVLGHEPLPVSDALDPAQWLYIAENPDQFEHFIVEQYSFRREYPLGQATTHLLGYTGAASEEQINGGYDIRERSGKSGIERQYEELLRGRLGQREVEINKAGIFVQETTLKPPARGTDLKLTIDAGLQQKAYQLLKDKNGVVRRGAIIVSALTPEARGEILALVSGPSYDATRLREPDYYRKLQTNAWKPELNRAIGLGFPPGSTFKMVTMSAALQTGAITTGTCWYCAGKKKIGRAGHEIVFHCHERSSGHQHVDIYKAMSESCDVAFYEMSLKIPDAPSVIREFGLEYGYGAKTGIDMPGEVKGTLPDAAWKFNALAWTGQRSEQQWYQGDTMNYSIGQGFLLVTPLQVLQSANIIAWDGESYPPRLLAGTSSQHGMNLLTQPVGKPTILDKDALAVVRAGMRKAVVDGTCSSLGKHAPNVCAKTGTAETKKGLPDHSWVVGYYPQDSPRYSFVCFFEYGGKSGQAAVPAARGLLDYLVEHDPLGRGAAQQPPASTLTAALN